MKKCRLCHTVVKIGQSHRCPKRDNRTVYYDEDDFMLRVATGSPLDETVGGSLLDGNLGDLLD